MQCRISIVACSLVVVNVSLNSIDAALQRYVSILQSSDITVVGRNLSLQGNIRILQSSNVAVVGRDLSL